MIKNNKTGQEGEFIGRGTFLNTVYYIVKLSDGKKEKWEEKDCTRDSRETWEMD